MVPVALGIGKAGTGFEEQHVQALAGEFLSNDRASAARAHHNHVAHAYNPAFSVLLRPAKYPRNSARPSAVPV